MGRVIHFEIHVKIATRRRRYSELFSWEFVKWDRPWITG